MDTAVSRKLLTEFIATQLHQRIAEWFTVKGRILFVEAFASKWADLIPTFLLQRLADASDGIDEKDLANWKQDLVTLGNQAIDIPYIPEPLEEQVIAPIVDMILSAAQKGFAIVGGQLFVANESAPVTPDAGTGEVRTA